MASDQAAAPPLWRWVQELLALPKVVVAPLRSPATGPKFGKGRPVLVIPGMLSSDRATAFLRASLNKAGFEAHGWGEGMNLGAQPAAIDRVGERLVELGQASSGQVVLIGWSLGGLYARALAQRYPEACALVVTLGSPFSGDRHANNAWRLYEALNDHKVDRPPFVEDPAIKPPAKTIAIWSGRDGIVAPQSASGEKWQSDLQIELPYKHFELATSRRAVTDLLRILRENLA